MMPKISTLIDTNVLCSPLTFSLLIEIEKLGLIQMYFNPSIINEYRLHSSHFKETILKENVDTYLKNPFINIIESKKSDLIFKIKDKSDSHLIKSAYQHNIQYIITFDQKAFYKSQLKELKIQAQNPDLLLFSFFKNDPTQLNNLLIKLDLEQNQHKTYLKLAQLKKLAQLIE